MSANPNPGRALDRRNNAIVYGCAVVGAVTAGWVGTLEPKSAADVAAGIVVLAVAVASPRRFVTYGIPVLLLVPPTIRFTGGGPDLTPLRLGVGLAVGLWLVLLSLGTTYPGRMPRAYVIPTSLFTLYVLLCALRTPETLSRAVSYSVEAFAVVWLIWTAVRSKADLLNTVDWLLVIGGLASLIAIYEAATQTFVVPEQLPFMFHAPDRAGGIRVQGIFPHALVLGSVCALLIPVGIARIATTVGNRRIGLTGLVLVMALALFFTSGRGPWLATVAGVGILAFVVRGGVAAGIVAAAVGGAVIIAFSPASTAVVDLLRGLIDPTAGQAAGAYTVTYRQELWNFTSDYVMQNPLGAGAGQSSALVAYAIVGGNATNLALSIDNAFAKYAIELGIAGVGLFALVIGGTMRTVWQARRIEDRELSVLATGIFAGQVGVLIASFTVATFSWAQFSSLFWLVAGCGLVIGRLTAQCS